MLSDIPRGSATGRHPIASGFENAIRQVDEEKLGTEMINLMRRLFPICRGLTGDGVRRSLDILSEGINLNLHQVPCGSKIYDWTVPREWNIKDGYIKDAHGDKIVDFGECNLHVISHSAPISDTLSLEELKPHLHTDPSHPTAIPYVTSYYEERWGFALSQQQFDNLADGDYEVLIDSNLSDGQFNWGDVILNGTSKREVFFSTYVCHPSMANDNLSGPVLLSYLCRLLRQRQHRYTYRFAYVPETIGALVYLSQNHETMCRNMDAGFVATCVGDAGGFTYKRSINGNTLADKAAEHCLKHLKVDEPAKLLDYFPTGSDERQYCSPGFDLPVGSITRSIYGAYPEYHTSLDNMELVSAESMAESLKAYLRVILVLELNQIYVNLSPYGEPQLSKRNLYPTLGGRGSDYNPEELDRIRFLLAYSNGSRDLIDIAEIAGRPAWEFASEIQALIDAELIHANE